MKRMHSMPFGAEIDERGAARFRLWAPSARSVAIELEIGGLTRAIEMKAEDGGWYEAQLNDAVPGTRYQYRIDDELDVPDPASRFNADGVHGPSVLVDPRAYRWTDDDWHGHAWKDLVIYELHVGTFTREGTYTAAAEQLADLAKLGVTAVEGLPIASFAGQRGWGYDGVLQYAPHPAYGAPENLKQFIEQAHANKISVLLDVVYNHFGPDGNYLGRYASDFFTGKHHTPWGDAIDFAHPTVRQFFIQNALYWINEYHFDGLRIDAVHAMYDDGPRHLIDELIDTVQDGPGRDRHIHIVLENHGNEVRRLRRPHVSQWNDDFHHAAHVILTGESESYYADFAEAPIEQLGRSLAEGFVFQGARSKVTGEPRGEPSAELSPLAFVHFLQNHDQIGNRAFGERLAQLTRPDALKAGFAILLLAPQVPMLFMGEEYAAKQPFLYFCDYTGELADAVREGRRNEFAAFAAFSDESRRERIPDPNAAETFARSTLRWEERDAPEHRVWREYVARLLDIRKRVIVPLIERIQPGAARYEVDGPVLSVRWVLSNDQHLHLIANLSDDPVHWTARAEGTPAFSSSDSPSDGSLAPWEVRVFAPEATA